MAQTGVFLPGVATGQLAYGATILSFLGGVRWGILVRGKKLKKYTYFSIFRRGKFILFS
jgi:hypothetical protein